MKTKPTSLAAGDSQQEDGGPSSLLHTTLHGDCCPVMLYRMVRVCVGHYSNLCTRVINAYYQALLVLIVSRGGHDRRCLYLGQTKFRYVLCLFSLLCRNLAAKYASEERFCWKGMTQFCYFFLPAITLLCPRTHNTTKISIIVVCDHKQRYVCKGKSINSSITRCHSLYISHVFVSVEFSTWFSKQTIHQTLFLLSHEAA